MATQTGFSDTGSRHPPPRLSWLVWGLGALLYFIGFYQRVAPAVMTDQLMSEFQIGAAALGNFSAFYFYSYVAMQIPTGLLADHWGPRKLLTAGSLVAAAGTVLFALAHQVALANVGRLLIGGSVAVAWVTLMKLAIHWFPPKRFAMVTGVALLFGVAGAVSAGVPLRLLVEWVGWRGVMWVLSLTCLAIGTAAWLVVRDDPKEKGYASFAPPQPAKTALTWKNLFQGLARTFHYRNTTLVSLAQGALVGSVLAFCGLWGVPYLGIRYGLTPWAGAAVTSTIMIAWALCGPALGHLSDRIGKRKIPYTLASITALLGWSAALYLPSLSLPLFVALTLVAGAASSAVIIGFAFAKESTPPELAGTVSGVCNVGSMSGPMILQPAIGWALDLQWTGTLSNGVRTYELSAYQNGFLLMIAWLLLSVVLTFFTRETFCRQTPSPEDEPR